MNDSTNIRIIADNIKKLDSRSSNLEKDFETAAAKIPKDYSTTEVETGLKWINDKTIFQKVLTGTTATEGSVTVAIDFDDIIDFSGFVKSTAGVYAPAVHILQMYGNATKTGLVIPATTTALYQGTDYFIIIYYTKPAPAPGNETKKKTTKKG